MIIEEVVPAALAGERLDRVVAIITGASRSDASALIAAGGAVVDDNVELAGKVRLREGQRVVIDDAHLPQPVAPAADPSVPVRIVHVDEHVIVVDKPAGLVVHPGAGNPDGTLVNGLLAAFPEIEAVGQAGRPGIVHRLDAGTSGLLVVARTEAAYGALTAALAARDVGRGYVTLVWGHLASPHGIIDAPVGRDHRDPMKMAVVVDGRSARTHYRVQSTFSQVVEVSEVACRLETGRTHQIRVHLSAIGHPVVGDGTYGGTRSGFEVARPMLHAAELRFRHPASGEMVTFSSPLADDMVAMVARLGVPDAATG